MANADEVKNNTEFSIVGVAPTSYIKNLKTIIDKSLSRKSCVFHFIGCNTKLYTSEQFALYSREELKDLNYQEKKIDHYKNVKYMKLNYFVCWNSSGQSMVNL